jgi:hypothetical protein
MTFNRIKNGTKKESKEASLQIAILYIASEFRAFVVQDLIRETIVHRNTRQESLWCLSIDCLLATHKANSFHRVIIKIRAARGFVDTANVILRYTWHTDLGHVYCVGYL